RSDASPFGSRMWPSGGGAAAPGRRSRPESPGWPWQDPLAMRQREPQGDPSPCWSALHTAAFDNDVEEVERQLVEGANIEDADKAGHTPLHLAARAGHFHVVDRLTGAKAHLEAKGGEYSGGTPEAWKARKARKVDQILFVF
ncbi:unnamed protein product, partial [Durusdinium trenchii]